MKDFQSEEGDTVDSSMTIDVFMKGMLGEGNTMVLYPQEGCAFEGEKIILRNSY
ncbi:hypothetical protein OAH87_01435 [Marinomonas sp.]|nr:hypothetical protein [Marinomonas sp.]MDB4837114.1 hypothetical protein [Marinomonas sp.]